MTDVPNHIAENGHASAPNVDIVIVNWNSGACLRECLVALHANAGAERFNLIVVDNASTDGSASDLPIGPTNFTVVQNADNKGFATASNQGAREGRAPYVLFLNPDVRTTGHTVDKATAFLDNPACSDIGILGVQLVDMEGRIQRCCARAPTVVTILLQRLFLDRLCPSLVSPHFLIDWDHLDTRQVDQVMGAFLLIRRALLEQLKGFDERYFLYYEDVDLCLSARRAGWQVVHFAGAHAKHAGGGSTNAVKGRRLYHLAISRAEYTAKWHGRVAAFALIVFTLCFEFPIRWLHAMVARSPQEGRSVFQAIRLFYKDLGNLTCRMGVRA
jgi:GT2 family glycosyltransferase